MYMFKRKNALKSLRNFGAVMLALFAFTFTACSDLNLDGAEGTGQMNFYLSDATEASKAISTEEDAENRPTIGTIEEVNIDVIQVRVKLVPNPADTLDPEPKGEWHDIPVDPFVVNLLDLSDADTLLGEADLPEGFYTEIRLLLGSDNEIVVDGEVHDLMVPSGSASGYKIKFNQTLNSGQEMDVTIEFDAEKSIHVTGNGRYMLQPVLHAFSHRTNGDG
jgi:hypothetical protein